jgi:cbb3-type cytochrome oxidase subunit 3
MVFNGGRPLPLPAHLETLLLIPLLSRTNSLFLILSIVLFIIVRRKRKQRHAQEARKNREIDDDIGDVEMVITGPRNPDQAYKHWDARGASPHMELEDPFERDSSRDVSPAKR